MYSSLDVRNGANSTRACSRMRYGPSNVHGKSFLSQNNCLQPQCVTAMSVNDYAYVEQYYKYKFASRYMCLHACMHAWCLLMQHACFILIKL